MCGIAGVIGKNVSSKDFDYNKILESMRHRGPDHQDFFSTSNFCFFHSLLKIMDLSDSSHQPFTDKNQNTLIFNGSIYNYKKIKEQENYEFTTNTDTEVILYLYNKYGLDFLNKINGMFAIAIFDKKINKIYLIRDQSGIKPLYYTFNKENLFFASEIKIITDNFLDKIDIKPNFDEVFSYIAFRHYNNNGNTFYNNIKSLKPGNYLEYDLNENKFKINEFFNFKNFTSFNKKHDQSNFNLLLDDTIKTYGITEHNKIASLLSGGVDSSLVTLALKKLYPKKEINTFSAILKNPNEENDNINKITNEFKIKNFKVDAENINFIEELKNTIKIVECPIPDASMIIHNILCRNVKSKGFKVLISGNGGDEFFFGYPSHKIAYISNSLENFKLLEFFKRLKLSLNFTNYNILFLVTYSFKELLSTKIKNFFKNIQFKIRLSKIGISNKNFKYYGEYNKNVFENIVLNNIYKWTQPIFLDYEDKNSMAYGIESRVPLYDLNLGKYTLSTKLDDQFKNGSKTILKKSNYLPNYVTNMKKKYGFAAPLYELIKNNKTLILNEIENNFSNIPFINKKKLILMLYKFEIDYDTFFRIYTYGVWYNLNFQKQKNIQLSCIGLWHVANLAEEFRKMNFEITIDTLYPKFFLSKNLKNFVSNNTLLYLINRYRNLLGKKIGYKISLKIHSFFSLISFNKRKNSKYCILWSSNALEYLKKNQKQNKEKRIICILERCSTHYSHQLKLLSKLNNKCGIFYTHDEINYEKKMEKRELEEYKLADYISVPSNFVKKTFIENGINERKIFVNNYGADIKNFFPLDIKVNKKNILFCGHADIRKGFHNLLDCLNDLENENINIIHYGTSSAYIKEKIKKNKYKNLISYPSVNHKQLNLVFNESSMLVLPSFEEGMAHVQLQALASGLPVVGTKESGISDIFDKSNLYLGEITVAGDNKKIIESILDCNKKFNNTYGEKLEINKLIKDKHSWKNYANRYVNFLDEI